MTILWLKAFHIIFVVAWFAGLFYLPRIFVNQAMATEAAEQARLQLMARKLYRFMTPLGILALVLGLWLTWEMVAISYPFTGWFHAKLVLVAVLIAYHLYCGHLVKVFERNANQRSHVFYRYFNELPVLLLVAVTILVVVKPF